MIILLGETFRRAKVTNFSFSDENFARRMVSPDFCIEILGKIVDGQKFFVGQNFQHQAKISTILSDECLSDKVRHVILVNTDLKINGI